MRWFKFDNNLVNDPLVQRLSGDKFKSLANMWCLVSSNGGVLPLASDLTFLMRPADGGEDHCPDRGVLRQGPARRHRRRSGALRAARLGVTAAGRRNGG